MVRAGSGAGPLALSAGDRRGAGAWDRHTPPPGAHVAAGAHWPAAHGDRTGERRTGAAVAGIADSAVDRTARWGGDCVVRRWVSWFGGSNQHVKVAVEQPLFGTERISDRVVGGSAGYSRRVDPAWS